MSARPRIELLRLVCAELPDDHAAFLRGLDPCDLSTHVRAYVLARKLGVALPPELSSAFVTSIVACMDAELEDTFRPPFATST